MAKQPKKSSATASKKAAPKKVPAPKAATKPSSKSATKKVEAAKPKSTAKKAVASTVTKTTATGRAASAGKSVKKPSAVKKTKPTKKPAGKDGLNVLAGNAKPSITSPAGGPVAPGANLPVTVGTNRPDLPYVITLINIGPPPTVVSTTPVPAPGTSPFSITIPGTSLPAGNTFEIEVKVDPSAGGTPPNSSDSITINT